jgi:hypothetical protein
MGARGTRTTGAKATTLRAVAFSDDGGELVLARRAGAKTGEFRIRVDAALIDMIKRATKRAVAVQERRAGIAAETDAKTNGSHAPRIEIKSRAVSKLSIKEIQALLRRGIAPGTIARRAGVDVSWVERFHGPILWERDGMVTRTQRATLRKPRGGPSGVPLAESISRNLRERRVDAASIAAGTWGAVKRPKKNAWVVTFSYMNRGREQKASWEYDPAADEIVAINQHAADIGWVPPPRRKRSS